MYQPELEAMPREELEALQLERLKTLLVRVYENVRDIPAQVRRGRLRPSLRALPRRLGSRAVHGQRRPARRLPLRHVRGAAAATSCACTLRAGRPDRVSVVGYTSGDIDRWADLMARTFACAGATEDDIVQVTYGYGLFTGGLGAHYGSERLGALTIPVSGGNTKRQVQILKDFGVTVLACTPSYALLIAETARGDGHRPARPAAAHRRLRRRAVERDRCASRSRSAWA